MVSSDYAEKRSLVVVQLVERVENLDRVCSFCGSRRLNFGAFSGPYEVPRSCDKTL